MSKNSFCILLLRPLPQAHGLLLTDTNMLLDRDISLTSQVYDLTNPSVKFSSILAEYKIGGR